MLVQELGEVSNEDLKVLWECFNEYLYDCFYQYGEYALNNFVDSNSDEKHDKLVNGSPYRNVIGKIKNLKTQEIFQKLVIYFAQKLSSEDIDYLESLANKTLTFYSLGLPKDIHQEVLISQIDWTIFVDTNFLYSVLGLHKNVETDASTELLKIVKELSLKVQFKYLPLTIQELKRKKQEFDEIIPKISYTPSQIKALLASHKLDSFSEIYYENLLKDENTLHPSKIVDTSERVMVHAFKMQIYNSNSEIISAEIDESVLDYERFINIKNEARSEIGYDQIYKHHKQILHDVTLNETIKYLRRANSENAQTFSEIKYFGLTLDKLLISFDEDMLRRKREKIPVFYTPSLILQRIRKFIPAPTDNYKRAFITAISSFNFYDKNVKRSKDIQKFVSYYKSHGLDDEKTLLNFLMDDIFLDNFFNENTDEDQFFESEINKKIKELQKINDDKEKEVKKLKHKSGLKESEVKIVERQIEVKEVEISKLKNVLNEIKYAADINKLVANEANTKNEVYENELSELKEKLNDIEKDRKLKEENQIYNNRKNDYINGEWNEKVSQKWGLKWVLFAWGIAIILSFTFFHIIDEQSPYKFIRLYFSLITFIISTSLSIFFNKETAIFSIKYWFKRQQLEAKYKKDFEKTFEKENQKPS